MNTSPEHGPTPDEIIEEHGLDQPTPGPQEVPEPELNPDHGPEHVMPEEHQVPLGEAARDLDGEEKEAA